MKKSQFYSLGKQEIIFTHSGHHKALPLSCKSEVILLPIQKAGGEEVLNTIATAVASGLANGNEKVDVALRLTFDDGDIEVLKINDAPLTRNNLDYHEAVKHARKLQEAIKKDLT